MRDWVINLLSTSFQSEINSRWVNDAQAEKSVVGSIYSCAGLGVNKDSRKNNLVLKNLEKHQCM